ncbi:HlyD family efflux transporter periplasmic adaptor subunit [Oscillatoria sp. CS-180]|uniref:HlyD family efflux transporter periplasmic adaptor subunit n=1 Tax=Oscillatoria sp. CS-180 TaxID=3021720 RepID=UPI002330D107|nr:HlyD family efflux transporter periplasmic adaptor subunit [Oscillatoria sp. CS-180]MDB9526148.1 HlyD family efflux transporter periplasmic adaptor subunit [Oscillatoria sp. CS-180]
MKPQFSLFAKPLERWILLALTTVAIALGYIAFIDLIRTASLPKLSAVAQSEGLEEIPTIQGVSALGRLEPQGDILRLSAPHSVDGSSIRIEQLLVQEGDLLEAGQVVAVLDNRPQREAALQQAEAAVEVAEAKLAKVEAGVPDGDIEAQTERINRLKAEQNRQVEIQDTRVARLTAELRNAEVDLQRYEQLYQAGAIATADLDSRQLAFETAQKQLREAQEMQQQTVETLQKQINEAEAAMRSIAEVRPVDVQVARAELSRAIAAVTQAQTDLDATYIRTPMAGQVLKTHVSPGEILNGDGIVEIGQTQSMMVVAEIYETDIERVQTGQAAIVTSPAVSTVLAGTVSKIGLQVGNQQTFGVDPSGDTDNRVVEVEIALDAESSQKVSRFSNLQVQVVLQ